MNANTWVSHLISGFVPQVPVLAICLTAVVLTLTRWQRGSNASLWALLGFGLALFLCFAIPIGQTVMSQWMMHGGEQVARRASIFGSLSLLWSALRAVSYALLLVAFFSGRAEQTR